MKTYRIQEIFYSLQGEGAWTGHPTVFIRFFGCNLKCKFCDTPQRKEDCREMSALEIWEEAASLCPKDSHFCLTGGEPLLQVDEEFLEVGGEPYLHLETNGTIDITPLMRTWFSWIVVSPKGGEVKMNPGFIDEVRYPYTKALEEYILNSPLKGLKYISPINYGKEIDWRNVDDAVHFCLKHPSFTLSMQLHKLIMIK